jgi:hypothetical protein
MPDLKDITPQPDGQKKPHATSRLNTEERETTEVAPEEDDLLPPGTVVDRQPQGQKGELPRLLTPDGRPIWEADIHEFPALIRTAGLWLYEATAALDVLNQRAFEEFEQPLLKAVCDDKTLTSESKKAARIRQLLASDAGYQKLQEEVGRAEYTKLLRALELEETRRCYQIAKIDYEAEVLGRRDGETVVDMTEGQHVTRTGGDSKDHV